MRIGMIGLPQAGKTTLFTVLTQVEDSGAGRGKGHARVGVARVPDPRLNVLAEMYRPRKVTPATLEFTDLPGFMPGEDRARLNEFLDAVRRADALVHVVRTFEAPELPHPLGRVDPAGDAALVDQELLLTDLVLADGVRQRLARGKKRPGEAEQLALVERVQAWLEAGRPVRSLELDPGDEVRLRGYAFLTGRPVVIAANVSEEQLRTGDFTGGDALAAYAEEQGEPLVPFCGAVEGEIAALPPQEQGAFLAAYGLSEPGTARLARAVFAALGLIVFFTAGEEEVKAWPIRAGTGAKAAAGKIHSDIERGFIRAEVVSFADLQRVGSMKAAREAGLLRLEGRDYPVADGDVITFRFNV